MARNLVVGLRFLGAVAALATLGSGVACSALLGSFEVGNDVTGDAATPIPTGTTNPDGTAPPSEGGMPDAPPPPPSCTAPLVACGSQCADRSKDPENCGVCGRSCGGGQCTAGVCEAVKIRDNPDAIVDIALDGKDVYFTTVNTVRACPKTGCSTAVGPRTIATMQLETATIEVVPAAGGATIAFLAKFLNGIGVQQDGVFACPAGGCTATPTEQASDTFIFPKLAVGGDSVIYSSGGLAIEGLRCAGGNCVKTTKTNRKSNQARFTANAQSVFFVENSAPNPPLRSCPIGALSCIPGTVSNGGSLDSIETMQFHAGSLFWTSTGKLFRCDSANCDGTTMAVGSMASPANSLAVDPTGAYWITQLGVLETCAVPGCAGGVKQLPVTLGAEAHSVRVDDRFVYWAEKASIWRIAK